MSMLHYTQVVFVKEGKEDIFNEFEMHVLPLLERHNGKLLYRVRPTRECVVESNMGYPYEIHLISFQSRKDFESYRDDNNRVKYIHLKDQAIEKTQLIEGKLL